MDSLKLSAFGELMAQDSPIVSLMADLGEALNVNPDLLFLGGGNPAAVPGAQQLFARHLQELSSDRNALNAVLGVYQSPQGNELTLKLLARYFRERCGWPVEPQNLVLVSGSQTAFFLLLNLFAGDCAAGGYRHVHLPLVPEYLGYASQGLAEGVFRAHAPSVELTGPNRFKYGIDFAHLNLGDQAGAVCVSRPTNPSGNLLTDAELTQLHALAYSKSIPLIVDLAYGQPFPNVVYSASTPLWRQGMINVMSLSKLGLPGVRTAVVLADSQVVDLITRANTIISLANGNLGPVLFNRLIESGDIDLLTQATLPQFYRAQRDLMVDLIEHELAHIPYRLHEPEGAFFVWLWFEGLPITSDELYQRLKQQGVLVMAGEPFFFGLEQHWQHGRQCIRLTYCQGEAVLRQAVAMIARELQALYRV